MPMPHLKVACWAAMAGAGPPPKLWPRLATQPMSRLPFRLSMKPSGAAAKLSPGQLTPSFTAVSSRTAVLSSFSLCLYW